MVRYNKEPFNSFKMTMKNKVYAGAPCFILIFLSTLIHITQGNVIREYHKINFNSKYVSTQYCTIYKKKFIIQNFIQRNFFH